MKLFLYKSIVISWLKKQLISFQRLVPTIDEYEFQPGYLEITERPPSPWSRGVGLGLTATLLLALIWSIVGHLDIQANASGQLLVSSHSRGQFGYRKLLYVKVAF